MRHGMNRWWDFLIKETPIGDVLFFPRDDSMSHFLSTKLFIPSQV